MEITGKIGALIANKGGQVWSLQPSASVYDAIAVMADRRVGALLVMQDGKLLGIVSERDYARKVILQGRSSHETPVSEIMSSPVVTVTPENTVAECMHLVTERRIRHLPVVENGRVSGMVSIGDLVNWVISEQQETIRHLETFISGVAS
jgi:CBS domain-containing protein